MKLTQQFFLGFFVGSTLILTIGWLVWPAPPTSLAPPAGRADSPRSAELDEQLRLKSTEIDRLKRDAAQVHKLRAEVAALRGKSPSQSQNEPASIVADTAAPTTSAVVTTPIPVAVTKADSIIAAVDRRSVISGKIVLQGNPPPEKELPMDPQCGKAHDRPAKTRFYVTGPNRGLADVFVYLKEVKSSATPRRPVVLDQKGCEYLPYIVGVQTRQTLLVHNSDPIMHNVHVTPTEPANKESNKAQLPRGPDLRFTFEAPELMIRFKCDVHPWMFAYVNVVESPYYAVTDPDGNFSLLDVPPGEYTIEAVHRKAGAQSKKVRPGERVDFTFDVR